MSKGLLGFIIILLGSASGLFAQGTAAPQAANPMTGNGYVVEAPAVGWSEECGSPQSGRLWGNAEYLLWWVKDGPLPFPLVTTGPGDTDNPGALGHGGVPFLTGRSVDYGALSGARVTLGTWLDAEKRLGLEGSGFLLPNTTARVK